MKFFQKKEITQEKTPILFRLERRHTLLDGSKDEDIEGEARRAYRANSVGSYTRPQTPTDTKPEATVSQLSSSNGNRSNYSAASTVVITESELSSSWLYNTRKAKIDSDEETISTNSKVPTEVQDIQPVQLQDPDLKPVPVPLKKRPEKVSSCCCYVLVAFTICLASLGILAAIGGIVYLEVFAAYREIAKGKHNNLEQSSDVHSNIKSESHQSTLHANEGWSLNGFRNLIADTPAIQDFIDNLNANKFSGKSEDSSQKASIDELSEKVLVSSNVDNLSEDSKIVSDYDDHINSSKITLKNSGKSEDASQKISIDELGEKVLVSTNVDNLSEDSKVVYDDHINSSEITGKNLFPQNNDVMEDVMHEGGSNHEDKVDSFDTIDSSSEKVIHIGTNDPVSSTVVFLDNKENEDSIKIMNQQDNADFSNNSNAEDFETMLTHQTSSRLPRMEQDIPVNNSLEVDNYEEISLDEKSPDLSLNDDQEYENGFEIDPQNQNLFDDSSLDYELVMNRPVVEAKPPIDFQRHLINIQNKDFDQPLTVQDMDMKFSLSEILKHLRTLEVNNQLPSTRQSQKTVTETMTRSVASHQDDAPERREYLNNLRRKIYVGN